MRFSMRRLPLLLLVTVTGHFHEARAQRPSDSSICDYYASQQYGSNSTETQFKLMSHIVSLAFGGGVGLDGPSESSTGILNPGNFQGQAVNLRSWFDGSSEAFIPFFFELGLGSR